MFEFDVVIGAFYTHGNRQFQRATTQWAESVKEFFQIDLNHNVFLGFLGK